MMNQEKKIYLIAAVSDNRVIGKNNRLPWHFPSDLKKFKELTRGSTVIMGRRTYESIGKPLSGRQNLVLSYADKESGPPNHPRYLRSLEEAVSAAEHENVFIIGGESVYRQALKANKVSGIYLTRIHQTFDGDAFFPEIPDGFEIEHRELLQEEPKVEFIKFTNTKKPAVSHS